MEVLMRDGAAFVAERRARGIDRYDEVHDGVYVVMNFPAGQHQRIVKELVGSLDAVGFDALPGVNVGEAGDYRGPDVAAWSERAPDGVWYDGESAPDLVIEVLSPSNTAEEMLQRRQFFHEHGVRIYAEVSLQGQVTIEFHPEQLAELEVAGVELLTGLRFESRA